MIPASCPSPGVLDPLRVNGFKFNIAKLPEITYFISRAAIPSISIPSGTTNTPLSDIKHPGDKLDYASFTIEFQVDEQMRNWNVIYFWMLGLGFPEDHAQYERWLNLDRNQLGRNPAAKLVSDAYLMPLSSAMQPLQTFTFVDLFPVSLSGPDFDATDTDNSIAKASATFEYSYIKTSSPWIE